MRFMFTLVICFLSVAASAQEAQNTLDLDIESEASTEAPTLAVPDGISKNYFLPSVNETLVSLNYANSRSRRGFEYVSFQEEYYPMQAQAKSDSQDVNFGVSHRLNERWLLGVGAGFQKTNLSYDYSNESRNRMRDFYASVSRIFNREKYNVILGFKWEVTPRSQATNADLVLPYQQSGTTNSVDLGFESKLGMGVFGAKTQLDFFTPDKTPNYTDNAATIATLTSFYEFPVIRDCDLGIQLGTNSILHGSEKSTVSGRVYSFYQPINDLAIAVGIEVQNGTDVSTETLEVGLRRSL